MTNLTENTTDGGQAGHAGHAEEGNIGIAYWIDGGEMTDCTSTKELLKVGGKVIDNACIDEEIGKGVFEGTDGKFYVASFEMVINPVSPDYLWEAIGDRLDLEGECWIGQALLTQLLFTRATFPQIDLPREDIYYILTRDVLTRDDDHQFFERPADARAYLEGSETPEQVERRANLRRVFSLHIAVIEAAIEASKA